VDKGPIFAIQTLPDMSIVVRSFVKSDKHPVFDLTLSETVAAPPHGALPTSPLPMSLDELSVGEPVFSFAVLSDDQVFDNEQLPGLSAYRFSGVLQSELMRAGTPLRFAIRLSFGRVTAIFEKIRDSVMLPFPCIQTDVPIYGGNSGGPLLDLRGRVCAVHCTSYEGSDIAFHVPVQGVLRLRARAQSLGLADSARSYSILELAVAQTVAIEPPMLDADNLMRSALRWLWYAAKCLARRERPSMNVHFAKVE
jgi:hypothetical protein